MGVWGAFGFAAATQRTYKESGLVLQEIERLRKVFSKDESVMMLLNNLKQEHRFMVERVAQIASSKEKGSPF